MASSRNATVSVADWFITSLIMCVPLVNLVMLFVWAFSDATPVSKSNWAKAALLWMVVAFGFYLLIFVVLGVGFAAAAANGGM